MSVILVTGGNGFIGRHLINNLIDADHECVSVSRKHNGVFNEFVGSKHIRHLNLEISNSTNWAPLLRGVDHVVHLANVAHTNISKDQEQRLIQQNVEATRALAAACAQNGVRHFIYLSSTKVYGEPGPHKITAQSDVTYKRCDAYGRSKIDAEMALKEVCENSRMSYTILRPPLVYGPGVKGNLKRLIQLARSGYPLPKIEVKRSVIAVKLLVDYIHLSLENDEAKNKTFLVADRDPVSFADWIRMSRAHFKLKPNLWPVPLFLFGLFMSLVGRRREFTKLTHRLLVQADTINHCLNITPDINQADEIDRMLDESV